MASSSGKTTIIVALIGLIGAIGAASIANIDKIEPYFISDAPEIFFHKAEFFSPDKGVENNNICSEKYILVSEVYKTNDGNMGDLILNRRSSTGNSITNKEISPKGLSGYYEYNYCIETKYLSPLKVKSTFKRKDGDNETTMDFHINFTKDQLKDANDWHNRIR